MAKRRTHPRHLEARLLADGLPAYYYVAPRAARLAGILASRALGRDRDAAIAQAEDLNRILDAWRRGAAEVGPPPAAGSLDWAIRRFRALRDRPRGKRRKPLSAKTRRGYDHYLDRLTEIRVSDGRRLGEVLLHEVGPREARQLYLMFGRADAAGAITAPCAARAALQVCRRLWALVGCGELGLAGNPFVGLDLGGAIGNAPWSGAKDRLAIAVAARLSTELRRRPAAALSLTWRDLAEYQRAGGTISAALAALLDALKRQDAVTCRATSIARSSATRSPGAAATRPRPASASPRSARPPARRASGRRRPTSGRPPTCECNSTAPWRGRRPEP